METVTDRTSNPFGLDVRCDELGGRGDPVPGYGDPNADFHLIGDHPGRHGGAATGVPFTGSAAGEAVLDALEEVGLVDGHDDGRPVVEDLYLSYLFPCRPERSTEAASGDGDAGPRRDGATAAEEPSQWAYDAAERYFDAELRAVNAHVLLPVGDAAVRRVLDDHTTRGDKLRDAAVEELHATQRRGRGFLVVPVREPTRWTPGDRAALVATLEDVLASDYRQTKGVATRIG